MCLSNRPQTVSWNYAVRLVPELRKNRMERALETRQTEISPINLPTVYWHATVETSNPKQTASIHPHALIAHEYIFCELSPAIFFQ